MKNIKLITAAIVLLGITFFISCDSRTLQDLEPKVDAASVTYTTNVKPILDAKCVSCHSAGNTFPDLDTYQNVKDYQLNNGANGYAQGGQGAASLLCSIQSNPCTSDRMPKGDAALSDGSITIITNWIANNYPQ